jgi:hypothetical protein
MKHKATVMFFICNSYFLNGFLDYTAPFKGFMDDFCDLLLGERDAERALRCIVGE